MHQLNLFQTHLCLRKPTLLGSYFAHEPTNAVKIITERITTADRTDLKQLNLLML